MTSDDELKKLPSKKKRGRPHGSKNKRTVDMAFEALGDGETPMEFVLQVMRNELEYKDYAVTKEGNVIEVRGDMPTRLRLEAAVRAMRYIHPVPNALPLDSPDGEKIKQYNENMMRESITHAANKLDDYSKQLVEKCNKGDTPELEEILYVQPEEDKDG